MNERLDLSGTYRTAEYVCRSCQTTFKVWGSSRVAGACPICEKDPGPPEVVG